MKGINGIISLLFVGLFVIAAIAFSIQLADDNDGTQVISTSEDVNDLYREVNTSLNAYSTDINGSYSSFASSIPVLGETIQILSVGANWKNILLAPFNIINSLFDFIGAQIFGTSNSAFSIIFTIITALILGWIILYAWKWIRGGDPD